mmetsp:Transcript_3054/g.5919  ORF Transcript_3054/g.5919 Transcript_3054/m.5919 type:complete len:267 (-) Transcript_3054:400-1200(-)|eukprot:CAMPEP_0170179544 /NCGR_PEP_ID=MMETSP0040_2-20121228/18251_1 /TAXON_ID=641309 /ORGANISM="Lotharella oceanica, Strain CCMP622" /LENGTH=266 /DNA_ID=CAMNT_0010423723 /DNA_START=85 /DNA_END=885 /DNA_ORIENTATION=-
MTTTTTTDDGKLPAAAVPQLTVKRLSAGDPNAIKQAASVMAKAFLRSPVYLYMWGDDDDDAGREAFLSFLFERNIQLRPQCCRCVTAGPATPESKGHGRGQREDEPVVVCSFMFIDPEVTPPSLWEMISVGLLTIPFRFGLTPMLRLLECVRYFGQSKDKVLGGERRALQLERMTVLPSFQGKGIGSRSLRVALGEAKARGLPVFLSTQEERNVRFYNKLGFKVVQKQAFPPPSSSSSSSSSASSLSTKKKKKCTNWSMLWEPPLS